MVHKKFYMLIIKAFINYMYMYIINKLTILLMKII